MAFKIMIAVWCLTSTGSYAIRVLEGDTALEPLVGNTLAAMAGGANILIQIAALCLILFGTTIRGRF